MSAISESSSTDIRDHCHFGVSLRFELLFALHTLFNPHARIHLSWREKALAGMRDLRNHAARVRGNGLQPQEGLEVFVGGGQLVGHDVIDLQHRRERAADDRGDKLLPIHVPETMTLGRAVFVLALAPEAYAPLRRLAAVYHDRQAAEEAADKLMQVRPLSAERRPARLRHDGDDPGRRRRP